MSGGTRDRYAVVGHPVAHSLSPLIHAHFAAHTGQSIRYDAIDVSPDAFESFWRRGEGRELSGANITLPHKAAAAALADELTERAARAGVVNTLKRQAGGQWLGDNTDGVGLVRDLTGNLGWPVRGQSLLVLGAGGAARGAVAALAEERPASMTIANRTRSRAEKLASDIGAARACTFDALNGPFDGIVHATSLGHQGAHPAVTTSVIGPHTWCYDMSYGPVAEPFLQWARAGGAQRIADGTGMLVEQAAESFFVWRGVHPETAEMIRQLGHEG